MTSYPNPLDLIDDAIAAGELAVDESGLLAAPDSEALEADLQQRRDERKLQQLDPEDDTTEQEQVVLGYALAGDRDNAPTWARFRTALGLTPLQEVPPQLFSDPARRIVAQELDAIFRGQRDVRTVNGSALVQSYLLRIERGHVNHGLQQVSEAVAHLQGQVDAFSDNDFRMAVDLLKSRRARAGLRAVMAQMERALKADRPVEQVVAGLADGVEGVRALVAGRLGTSHEFVEPAQVSSNLLERMTRQKAPTMPTGIDAIDIDIMGGVNRGNTGKLHVLAARTGVGKTTVAIAAGMGLIRSGADVLFLSCELEQAEIDARAFANQAYANGFKCPGWILEGRGSSNEPPADFQQAAELWQQQTEARQVGRWMSKALFMAGAEQFVDFMHAAKAKNPRLSAVFIDHFHAMAPSRGYSNRSTEMEARALLLHGAAKACQVDLFLLAQLNREACLAKRPSLEHINGTDAIAQLGSAVMLLEFPPRPEGAPFDPSQLVLYHGKKRNGQRREGRAINVEESGLLVARDTCTVKDCALPFI